MTWVLVVAAVASLMAALDATVVSSALTAARRRRGWRLDGDPAGRELLGLPGRAEATGAAARPQLVPAFDTQGGA